MDRNVRLLLASPGKAVREENVTEVIERGKTFLVIV